jgi:hypothetical protein
MKAEKRALNPDGLKHLFHRHKLSYVQTRNPHLFQRYERETYDLFTCFHCVLVKLFIVDV